MHACLITYLGLPTDMHTYTRRNMHAPSSRHLRALLSVCGGFGVLFLSCRVVSCCSCRVVSCVVLFLLCVCVYGLFLFLHSHREDICSADGSTHTESNKLYRKVKHRYRPNLSPRQRPTAKARHDQAALAASAEARGATHRARPRSPSSYELPALTALAQHISHSYSGIDEKRPTEKFVRGEERPIKPLSLPHSCITHAYPRAKKREAGTTKPRESRNRSRVSP